MPLNVRAVAGAGQNGPAMPGNLQNAPVATAIANLSSGDIFGGHPATIIENIQGWRVDRQNPPPNHVNISVQRNGIGAPSTVASVFIPTHLNIAAPLDGPNNVVHRARMLELQKVTRRGLLDSFASRIQLGPGWVITRFEVYGDFSA